MQRKLIIILSLIIILLTQSCKTSGCGDDSIDSVFLCEFQDYKFSFIFIDKSSGENLLANNNIKEEDIKITNLKNNETLFFFIENNRTTLIDNITEPEKQTLNYSIEISGKKTFNLTSDIENKIGECCNTVTIKNITVLNSDFEKTENNTYTIFIE